ncbi:Secreted protein [Pseudonocardia sp. Ae168_Ps1]|uniref:alpha/beta hydrolase family protein n=2 Tax=Pseudonocardia TaxID=1847 RepID=UPI00094B0AB7|nr:MULTISPECIES: alpha/beta fold hydrolase [unclassified Pseudonocardia]OLL75114.1 Secreted protein [Pseudonocardia sp. Ae150A_Ps1]OLL81109.1 Secreted protein [Pseudonocardia sp. Ae168_Ps1]OLL84777.1 Secreted protein [Pseudonocardia sp. Ae263_Ps1]OLL95206.1 Secreted protein [Pseudonocardia sp. Ae356_Ps1]
MRAAPIPSSRPVPGYAAAGVLAGALGGAGGAAAVCWHYSTVLLHPSGDPGLPERVLAAGDGTVELARTRLVSQPGVWGLRGAAGLSVVGPVLERDRRRVVRELRAGPVPETGAAVLDAGPFDPDPGARGLEFDEVEVPTDLGPAPAWRVAPPSGADDGTWALCVHGRGGTRREALRMLPALHAAGLTSLVVSYRGDGTAPAAPDGRSHLGDTEWEDVAAAAAYAVVHGARRLVLVGWSMGAAVGGAFLDRSAHAGRVAAVVWDAPLLDWRRRLRRQARNRALPPSLAGLAALLTERRIGIDLDRFDLVRNPPAVRPPTLLLHSDADTAVPVELSRDLATTAPARGWPVTYREFAGTEHTGSWNADPDGYEAAVTGFLGTVLPG